MNAGGFDELFFNSPSPSLEFFPSLDALLTSLDGWYIIKSKKTGPVGKLLVCRVNNYFCYLLPIIFIQTGLGFYSTSISSSSPVRFHINNFSIMFFNKQMSRNSVLRHLSSLKHYHIRLLRKLWKNA